MERGTSLPAMPLEGITIVDMTFWQQGTVATAMLADMGAEVIKIEGPDTPDPGRYLKAYAEAELSYYFENNNRGKKCVAVDLKQTEGREILYRLVKRADVFVSNYRVAALKRLGADYATLSQHNPNLIYAIGSGFGRNGPEIHKPLMDVGALARGGLISLIGEPGQPPPFIPGNAGDQMGATVLAYGLMVALFVRERTGIAQEVDVSLLGSQIHLGALVAQTTLFHGHPSPRRLRKEARNPLWNTYRAGDDRWLCLSMAAPDAYWPSLCEAMGLQHLEKDPRFSSNAKRRDNCTELIAILDETFATRPAKDWVSILESKGVICALVATYEDVIEDPQALENGYIIDAEHPTAGPVKMVGIPVQLSRTPGRVRGVAPVLGQHTEEVLLELGYTPEDIDRLRNERVIMG